MTLAWDDPSDSAITGYEYQVNHNHTGTGNLTGWGEWTAIPGSGAGASSYDVDGLTNGSEYRFRLRAVNDVGPSESTPTGNPGYVSVLVGLAEAANRTDYGNLIEVSSLAQLNGQARAAGTWTATAFPATRATLSPSLTPSRASAANPPARATSFGPTWTSTPTATAQPPRPINDDGDTYWNGGAGWNSIDRFAATFRIYQARGQQRHRQQPRTCQ